MSKQQFSTQCQNLNSFLLFFSSSFQHTRWVVFFCFWNQIFSHFLKNWYNAENRRGVEPFVLRPYPFDFPFIASAFPFLPIRRTHWSEEERSGSIIYTEKPDTPLQVLDIMGDPLIQTYFHFSVWLQLMLIDFTHYPSLAGANFIV